MKKTYKRVALAVIAAVCLILWARMALSPVPVETEAVALGNLERTFTVKAELTPARSTVLNASAAGRVTGLPFQAGQEVEAGQVLLSADTSREVGMDLQREQIKQQLDTARRQYDRLYGDGGQAQSALAEAKSGYRLAQKSYDSGKVLADSGDMARAEFDKLKAERDVAYQRYLMAQADMSEEQKAYLRGQIESWERQLSAAEDAVTPGALYMPYKGVLWECYVEEGAYLSQNQPVMKVYPAGEMKLEASVLAEDAALLDAGAQAEAVYPDGERTQVQVTFIARTAAQKLSSTGIEESRRQVELTAGQMPKEAGAGQQADVTFRVVKAGPVLTVSSTAVVPNGRDSEVYVVRAGKAEAAVVETGLSEGGKVEIISGLSEGDQVVTDPYEAGVKDGTRVAAQDGA